MKGLNKAAFLRRSRASIFPATRILWAAAFRFACTLSYKISYVFGHIVLGLFACSVDPSPDPLTFQQVEEALRNRVVVAVSAEDHRV